MGVIQQQWYQNKLERCSQRDGTLEEDISGDRIANQGETRDKEG